MERLEFFRVMLLVLGMALLDTAGVASLMPFLAVVGDPEIIQNNSLLNSVYASTKLFGLTETGQFLILLGICSFCLLLISAVYRVVAEFKMNSFVEQLRHSISSRLLRAYLAQPYEFFMERNTSDLSKSALSEVDQLIGAVIRPVVNMFAYSIVAICITIFLLYLYPLLLIFSFVVLGGSYAITFSFIKPRLDKLGRTRTESNKNRFLIALEALNGIRELRLLGYETFYAKKYDRESYELSRTLSTNLTLSRVPKYIIEAIAFGGIIILLLSLIVSDGGVESEALGKVLPLVGVFTFAAYRLQPTFHFIFSGLASLRFGKTAVDKIFDDLCGMEAPLTINDKLHGALKLDHELEIKNLSFKYSGSDKPAIEDVSFKVPAGSVVGIVGTTGCGKTTLVNLISHLLIPDAGSIVVDGNDISLSDINSWQRAIGCVPQDIFLTDNTLAENIAFGNARSSIDSKKVIECAKLANIHGFIANELVDGYETIVGERGVRLSGGQRQRIGIARALYHEPSLLIFDEATSALDNIVEKAIMEAIDNLSKNHTIIIIAHRMNTIMKCDNIVMLHQGRLEAQGNFQQLMDRSHRFREMSEALTSKLEKR